MATLSYKNRLCKLSLSLQIITRLFVFRIDCRATQRVPEATGEGGKPLKLVTILYSMHQIVTRTLNTFCEDFHYSPNICMLGCLWLWTHFSAYAAQTSEQALVAASFSNDGPRGKWSCYQEIWISYSSEVTQVQILCVPSQYLWSQVVAIVHLILLSLQLISPCSLWYGGLFLTLLADEFKIYSMQA